MSFLAAGAQYLPAVLGGVGAYKAMRAKPAKQAAIPMPDEEMIQKQRRRAGPSRAGRASTILSGTDDGLGG